METRISSLEHQLAGNSIETINPTADSLPRLLGELTKQTSEHTAGLPRPSPTQWTSISTDSTLQHTLQSLHSFNTLNTQNTPLDGTHPLSSVSAQLNDLHTAALNLATINSSSSVVSEDTRRRSLESSVSFSFH